MHTGGLIHRDLKPPNILLNAGKQATLLTTNSKSIDKANVFCFKSFVQFLCSDCHVKVCDFGLARTVNTSTEESVQYKMTDYVATRW